MPKPGFGITVRDLQPPDIIDISKAISSLYEFYVCVHFGIIIIEFVSGYHVLPVSNMNNFKTC